MNGPAFSCEPLPLVALGRTEEARESFNELIRRAPHNAEAYMGRARLWAGSGGQRAQLHDLEMAVRCDPSLVEAWIMMGGARGEAKQYEEALAAYDRALQLGERTAHIHTSRGHALMELRRYEEALAAYSRVCALEDYHPRSWTYVAQALSELNRYEEALAAYEEALRLDPNSPLVPILIFNKASILLTVCHYEAALATFEQAIGTEEAACRRDRERHGEGRFGKGPDMTMLALDYFGKAQALAALQRTAASLEAFRHALTLCPDDGPLRQTITQAMRSLRQATTSAQQDKPGSGGANNESARLALETDAVPGRTARAELVVDTGWERARSVILGVAVIVLGTSFVLFLFAVGRGLIPRPLWDVLRSPLEVIAFLFYPLICWCGWAQYSPRQAQGDVRLAAQSPATADSTWRRRLWKSCRASFFGWAYLLFLSTSLQLESIITTGAPMLDSTGRFLERGFSILLALHLAICIATFLAVVGLSLLQKRQAKRGGN